ncbi:MAG: S1/P1 Nuclease [Reichenbachiella sp.]
MNHFSRNRRSKTTILLLVCFFALISFRWGFHAHKKINRLAVFTLPEELIGFYKIHIVYLTENAVNPDRRRYAVKEEAARHFIDLDVYGDSALLVVPHRWDSAISKYTEDTLQANGIVPWYILTMKNFLTHAFEEKNLDQILRLSADIGHYIADANVPLHTTENYNGQMTGQHGIHGFWESRLPELYDQQFNFFVGKAEYIVGVQEYIWQAVERSHLAVDSVLEFERVLNARFPESKKYSFEDKGKLAAKVYSKKYSYEYHKMLNGMVERQMRSSIKMIGDLWYTAWVDAGQPEIEILKTLHLTEKQKKKLEEETGKWELRIVKSREHN